VATLLLLSDDDDDDDEKLDEMKDFQSQLLLNLVLIMLAALSCDIGDNLVRLTACSVFKRTVIAASLSWLRFLEMR
jgi:hypothetical protein